MSEPARHLRAVPSSKDPTEGQVPPHDLDAEAAILSAAVLDVSALPKIVDFLQPDHFYSEANRRIFEACVDLFERREPIDTLIVSTWLKDRGRLAQVGGMPYVVSIVDASPVVANVRAHALAVYEYWRRRKIIHACRTAVAEGYGAVPDVQRYCDSITKTLGLIGQQNPARPSETNAQVLARILSKALDEPKEDAAKKQSRGFPTKLYTLDTFFDGYRPGAKTTVAATTGVGKTAFAIQAATSVAPTGGGVIFWSMEMKKEEILRRALSAQSGVPAERIKRRELSRGDATAMIEAANWLNKLPLYIEESPRPTIEEIRARTAAMIEKAWLVDRVRVVLVIIDYIQRCAPSRDVRERAEHEQIAHATTGAKTMAQELEVAVLELAQAKEADQKRRGRKYRPKAEDCVAGSKRIAKECDEFILLIPDGDERPDVPDLDVTIWMPKQRDGRRGEADVVFHRDVYRFEDMNDPMRCASRDYLEGGAFTEEHDG